MLAVVVDDHDMGVTHVIRGDDHLNNAFRQLAIIRAMGWPEPIYGHVPLIHGADGAKLASATARSASRPIATISASFPRRCSTICCASAGAMATRRSSAATTPCDGSTSTMSASPRRASTSRSWRTSTAIIMREADPRRLASLIDHSRGALGRCLDADDVDLLAAAMPELKPRAKDLNELAEALCFCSNRGRWRWTRRPRPCSPTKRGTCSPSRTRRLSGLDGWSAEATEQPCSGRCLRHAVSSSARWRSRSARRSTGDLAGHFRCAGLARAR